MKITDFIWSTPIVYLSQRSVAENVAELRNN